MVKDIDASVVEAPVSILEKGALARLQDKRVALERVVLQYGEAPAGIKEVFELCRGFERAYHNYINESVLSMKIKDAFTGEKGLQAKIKKADMDKVFELSSVKSICRVADGYQPSLVAPEKGLRKLAATALDLVIDPVKSTVQEVYNMLLSAAKEAAEKAGQFTEAALMGAMPLYVPDFKNVVVPAATVALEEWRQEAEKMALMLVDMERSFLTAGFFRQAQHHRYMVVKQQEAIRLAAEAARLQQGKLVALQAKINEKMPDNIVGKVTGSVVGATLEGAMKAKELFPSFGGGADAAAAADGAKPDGPAPAPTSADDFIAGYFDKCVSDESARGFLDTFKWQRRFFVFSESQRVLYYFKSPDDVTKANGLKGQVNVAECVVEDLDEKGNPRPSIMVTPADKNQLMIRIRHKDPRGSAVKDHNAIILRADAYETKATWIVKLRRAAEPSQKLRAVAAVSAASGKAPADPASKSGAGSGEAPVPESEGSPSVEPLDMSWAQEAEPFLDTHLGQGSTAFRAEAVREADGRLMLAPPQILNPLRAQRLMLANLTPGEAWQQRYEALLDQFASDLALYMQCVCDTIVVTMPKAVVHCMVKKSEKNLLERLFNVIHGLTPTQMENLLREEDNVVRRRKAARAALERVKTAIYQVQTVLERHNLGRGEPNDRETLPSFIFAYAGIREILSEEQLKHYEKTFNDDDMPDCIRLNHAKPLPPALLGALRRSEDPTAEPGATAAEEDGHGGGAPPPPSLQRMSVGGPLQPNARAPHPAVTYGPPPGARPPPGAYPPGGQPPAVVYGQPPGAYARGPPPPGAYPPGSPQPGAFPGYPNVPGQPRPVMRPAPGQPGVAPPRPMYGPGAGPPPGVGPRPVAVPRAAPGAPPAGMRAAPAPPPK